MSPSPIHRSTHEIPIRGDLLSCFTTALATYLAHYGIDYTFAFGLQLYLATHFEQRDGLKGAFIHQHRPLPALLLCIHYISRAVGQMIRAASWKNFCKNGRREGI